MNKIRILICNNLKLALGRKPLLSILLMIIPVIILVGSSKLINYQITYINVGIADDDNTYLSNTVKDLLLNIDGTKSFVIKSDEIEPLFKNNTINVCVQMKEGFEDKIRNGEIDDILVYANEGSNDYKLVSSLLKNHVLNFRNIGRIAGEDPEIFKENIQTYMENSKLVEVKSLNDLYSDYNNSNLFIGFLIMLVFFRSAAISNTVNLDKETNVYTRMFTTGVTVGQYYLSNIISNLLVVMMQILIALIAMPIVNISMGMSLLSAFIILSLVALVAVSFGTLCIAICNETSSASMLANMFILVFVLLGGSFIQVEFFPDLINKISYVSPVRWAIQSVLMLQQGASFRDIYMNLVILLLFAVGFFGIASFITFKKDKQFQGA